jgi:UDP-N-acetylglucosamine/UDP-N-acetylgalactosamine 4-epimerase
VDSLTEDIQAAVQSAKRTWLVTGAAGFIGSHLLETLLRLGQQLVSLDNFATGRRANLDEVAQRVGEEAWRRHRFIEGDIADPTVCAGACKGIDFVLHQAALGSVPRSIDDPLATHRANVTGFLNMLVAARDAKVRRFVYAASSSTYGDHPALPKVEEVIGRPLSPYAATKLFNEVYAEVFGRCYGLQTIGLRYFNVFGARQDPDGPYAAVIPRWAADMLAGRACRINGDGLTSRDFCHVANAVQANLRAALVPAPEAVGQVYNVAVGGRTTLNELHSLLARALQNEVPGLVVAAAEHGPFRAGDVMHSQADIGKARRLLGYEPALDVRAGLHEAAGWYARRFAATGGPP